MTALAKPIAHQDWTKQDWTKNGLSVLVPTYQRPEGIRIALESLLRQMLDGRPFEVIIADNDPKASAKDYVAAMAKQAPGIIHYVHVPEPGVSNARNGAMKAARGRYIAFLDDDMDASENWALSLVKTSNLLAAGLVFGPVTARMADDKDPRNSYLVPFFSRLDKRGEEDYITKTQGTGGCLLDLTLCSLPDPIFDPGFNETGGEDDELFRHLADHGTKIAWSPAAKSIEDIPAKRTTDRYIWQRNFAFGQGAITSEETRGGQRLFRAVRHMAIGLVQISMFAPLWFGLKLARRPGYVAPMARTAQGVGKLFWSDRYSPRLYGQAALKPE